MNCLLPSWKRLMLLVSGGLALFLIGGGSSFPRTASVLKGVVTAVYDGDTLRIKLSSGSERKVRLIGIDTPEMDDEREDVRYRAFLAKRFAYFHLYRERISLELDWEREDEYGRILAYVWWNDRMFNEFILREGFAALFLKYPFRRDYRRRFIAARNLARLENAGFRMQAPYPETPLDQLENHLGELVSIRFLCHTRSKGRFVFLNTEEGRFSALVSVRRLADFPDLDALEGEIVRVSGFLEEYRGNPQIMLAFPRQLEMIPSAIPRKSGLDPG